MGTTSSPRWQKLGRYQSNARNRPRGVDCSLMAVCTSSSIAGDAEDERRRLDTCSGLHRHRLMEAYLPTPLFRFRDLLGVLIWLFLGWTFANLCGSVEGNTTGAISVSVRWWGSRGGVKRGRPISSGRFEDERNARYCWKLSVLCVLGTCTKPSPVLRLWPCCRSTVNGDLCQSMPDSPSSCLPPSHFQYLRIVLLWDKILAPCTVGATLFPPFCLAVCQARFLWTLTHVQQLPFYFLPKWYSHDVPINPCLIRICAFFLSVPDLLTPCLPLCTS